MENEQDISFPPQHKIWVLLN